MALHVPDIDLSGLPAAALADLDQQFAVASGEVDEMVDDARRFLAAFGPTIAPGMLAEALVTATGGSVEGLAGALGIALVELARREAT